LNRLELEKEEWQHSPMKEVRLLEIKIPPPDFWEEGETCFNACSWDYGANEKDG
jgi:hypothetical protein